MLSPEEKTALVKIIHADPHIDPLDKRELTTAVTRDDTWVNGVYGAGAAFAVTHFLGLSRNAQILLTIAGYGIGKYLLDNRKKGAKLLDYNEKTRTYNINT